MNSNNRNIILGGVLVTVAALVFIFLVPNFEREEFENQISIAAIPTTTTTSTTTTSTTTTTIPPPPDRKSVV